MKKIIILIFIIPLIVNSQDLIYVPDDALEYYLENDHSYQNLFNNGIDNDNYVLNADVGFLGAYIDVPVECEDLTGLEQIIIKNLTVSNNFYIEEINLSNYQFIQNSDLSALIGGGEIEIENNLSLNKIIFPSNNQFIGRVIIINNYLLNCIDLKASKLAEIVISNNNSITSLNFNNVEFVNENANYSPNVHINENSLVQINFLLNNLSYVLIEDFDVDYGNPNLECIVFDNIDYVTNNQFVWNINENFMNNSFDKNLDCNSTTSLIWNNSIDKKSLIKTIDLLGKKTKKPMIYIFDDGSVEKKVIIE